MGITKHQLALSFKLKVLFFLFSLFFTSSIYAKKMENFSLPIYGSKEAFHLKESLKKGRVILNFWASWCTSCAREIPELEELKKRYPKAQFIGINVGDKKKKIKKFIKKYNFSYLILEDRDKSFSKKIGISELPQTLVLGRDGEIHYQKHIPPKEI